MAEEEQEKKKTTILRRIFKWIGLGLLTLLIVLALVFQAPWKATALLIIILLACTALPKQMRKWFWLSVAVIIAVLIIWVFLPDRNGDWRRYTFDDELAALEAKRAVPPEENAARFYNELLEYYDANGTEPDFLDREPDRLTVSKPWSSEDYPELAEWLKGHQSMIATLLEAAKMEKCRFPVDADFIGYGQTMDRLGPMRRWARLLIRAGNNDIADGRTYEALGKYVAILQMAKHLCQQPTIIDNLVGFALEALATGRFNRFAVTGGVTEEQLDVIEEALAEIKHDWCYDLPRVLECEKLLMKNTFGIAYEINSEGKVRLGRNPMKTVRAEWPEELPPLTYWHKRLGKIAFIMSWFYMPSTPQKAGEIIDAAYEKHFAMAEPDFNWQKEPEEPEKFSLTSLKLNCRFMIEMLVQIMEPSYYGIHDIYLQTIAQERGSQIVIALRRYKNKTGRWPESLDDVKALAPAEIFVDPINGGSFVYKLTEENFKLYSKGKNGIDEGGEYESRFDFDRRVHIAEEDDRLIWPAKSHKTKKENADAE